MNRLLRMCKVEEYSGAYAILIIVIVNDHRPISCDKLRNATISSTQTLVIEPMASSRNSNSGVFSRTQAEGITEALKELDISPLATKLDFELALAKQPTTTTITWKTGILVAQGALIVALIEYFK